MGSADKDYIVLIPMKPNPGLSENRIPRNPVIRIYPMNIVLFGYNPCLSILEAPGPTWARNY